MSPGKPNRLHLASDEVDQVKQSKAIVKTMQSWHFAKDVRMDGFHL